MKVKAKTVCTTNTNLLTYKIGQLQNKLCNEI